MTRDERIKAARSFIGKTVEAEPLFTPHGVSQLRYAEWQAVAEMMEAYRDDVDAKRQVNAQDLAAAMFRTAAELRMEGWVGPDASKVADHLQDAAQTIERLKSQLLEADVTGWAQLESIVKGDGGGWPGWVNECRAALKIVNDQWAFVSLLRERLQVPGSTSFHECLNIVSRLVASYKER